MYSLTKTKIKTTGK